MTTNHTGDGSGGFNNTYALMTDVDPPHAQLFRVPLGQLANNLDNVRDGLGATDNAAALLAIRVSDLETGHFLDEDWVGARVQNSSQFMVGASGVWTNNLAGSSDTEDAFVIRSAQNAPGIMRLSLPGSGPTQLAVAYGQHDGFSAPAGAFYAGQFASPRAYIEFRYAPIVAPLVAADYDMRMGLFVGDVPGFGVVTKAREVQLGNITGDGGIWSVSGADIQPINPVLTQPIDGEYRRIRFTSGVGLLDTTTVYSSTGAVLGTRVHSAGLFSASDVVYLGAWVRNPNGDAINIDIDRIRAFAAVTR